MFVFLVMCVGGEAWGVDGGWMPLPTHPQQLCNPCHLLFMDLLKEREIQKDRQTSSQPDRQTHRIHSNTDPKIDTPKYLPLCESLYNWQNSIIKLKF